MKKLKWRSMKGRFPSVDNRGFSLVELIIVTAIMAVLIGIVGTQVIPYLENARQAKDIQILTAYATAGVASYTYHADSSDGVSDFTISVTSGGASGDVFSASIAQADDVASEMKGLMGKDYVSNASSSFNSKAFKQTTTVDVFFDFDNRKVEVYAKDASGTVLNETTVMGVL